MPVLTQGQTIRLSGELRHADAAPLLADLKQALAEGPATVDAGAADALPFGVLQVLVSAKLTARHLDRSLQLHLPEDPALRQAATDAGLAV